MYIPYFLPILLALLTITGTAIPQSVTLVNPSPAVGSGVVLSEARETCPHDLLREAYMGLSADDPSALDIFVVEKEVLLLCEERQQLLLTIARNEIELRELLEIRAPAAPFVAEAEPLRECPSEPTAAEIEDIVIGDEPEGLAAGELVAVFLEAIGQLSKPAIQSPEPGPESCGPHLDMELFSLTRTGREYRATLRTSDGREFNVTEGDKLPDGSSVAVIDASSVILDIPGGKQSRIGLVNRQGTGDPGEDAGSTPSPESPSGGTRDIIGLE
ncbi:MAG: hypothetical protein OXH65_02865 [Paracoccaceae bacterium]|nr:hypothetical protein [Paracoccaceae bacterium]